MNMLMIDLIDETNQLTDEHLEEIEKLLNFAAEKENVEGNSEVSVTFVTNERIHEINRNTEIKMHLLMSSHSQWKRLVKVKLNWLELSFHGY